MTPNSDVYIPAGRRSAWGIVAASIALAFWLLVDARLGGGDRFWDDLRNFGHLIVFGFLAYIFFFFFSRLYSRNQSYLLALAACLAMGVATEYAQSFQPSRPFSGADIARDLAGTVITLGFIHRFSLARFRVVPRIFLLLVCTSALVIAALPLLDWTAAFSYRAMTFPQLAGFDTSIDEKFMWQRGAEHSISTLPGQTGAMGTRVTFGGERAWPRLAIATRSNWHGYKYLAIELLVPVPADPNTGASLSIHVRDSRGGSKAHKWEQEYSLVPGKNTIRIDLEKIKAQSPDLNQGAISRLMFYGKESRSDFVFFLVSARLEH